ncbi:MAG: outer membrane protein OmpB [Rickettsiaceae bacterium]|jgi:outer membrane autotransporter protein|nr:outer membrane protein OmpB [Rickettsiaceae bacterium]
MTKKPSLLKTMLATASTVAVLLGSVEALAAINTTSGAADTTTGTNVGGSAIANGDTIKFGGTHTLTVDSAVTGLILDANSNAATVAVAAGGSGATFGKMTGPFTAINFTGAATATLTDSTAFTATNITFANAAAKLSITANSLNLTAAIDGSGGAGRGILDVQGAGVTITGAIGSGTTVDQVLVANSSGTTTFTSTIAAATRVDLTGVGSSEYQGAVTSPVRYSAVATATFKDNLTGAVAFQANDGTIQFTKANGATVTGAISTTSTNVGTVIVSQDVGKTTTQSGAVGGSGNVLKEVRHAGYGVYHVVGNLYATTTNLTQAGSTLRLDNGTVATNIVFTNNNSNIVEVANAAVTYSSGAIGSTTAAAKAINFGSNHGLTIADGVKVYTNAFTTSGAGTGKLTLQGDISLPAVGTGSYGLAEVNVGATKTVTATKDIYSTIVDFSAGAGTLVVNDGVSIHGNITSTVGASAGTVNFVNSATVAGTQGTSLKAVNIKGTGTVYYKQTFAADALKFEADGTAKIDGAITMGGNITTTAANTGTVIAKAATGIQAVGTSALPIKEFRVADDITVTSNGAYDLYTNFTTATNEKGTLTLSGGAHTVGGNIGATSAAFKALNVSGGAITLKGNNYAKTTTLGSAHNVTLEKSLHGDSFTFATYDQTLTLKTGGTLNAIVKTGTADQGTVSLEGDATISKDLGESGTRLKAITLAGTDKTVKVGANMYATTITPGQNTVKFTQNATMGLAGYTVNVANSTLDAGTSTVTIPTALTNVASATIKVTTTGSSNGMIDNSTYTTAQDFTNTKLVINTAADALPTDSKFVVLKGGAAPTAVMSAANVSTSSRVFKYTVTPNGNNIEAQASQIANLQDLVSKASGANAMHADVAKVFNNHLLDGKLTGNAKAIAALLANTTTNDELKAELDKIIPNSSASTAAVDAAKPSMDVNKSASYEVSSRLLSLNTGAAAGEAGSSLGAWVKGFFGNSTEKAKGNASGYKASLGGATLGFDMNANDATVLGAAVTVASNDAKFKNVKSGDKLDALAMLFNMYGMYDLGNDMFVQGGVNFGNTNVKATTKRTFGTATGKYDVMSYGASAMVGMNYKAVEGMVVTPLAGLNYGRFLRGGYSETGAGASNQIHNKMNFDKLVGTLGLRLTGQMDAGSDMKLTPEAHAFVNHDFRNEAKKDSFTIDGLGETISVKGTKPAATSYNLGLSLTAKSGNMEYGVGYDAEMRTKHSSHQGSVKVRINF